VCPVVERIAFTWIEDRIVLSFLTLSHLEEYNRPHSNNSVDDKGGDHHREDRAESQAEITLTPLNVFVRVVQHKSKHLPAAVTCTNLSLSLFLKLTPSLIESVI
jgi:hypothetical protein